jgi:hypothetical protein
MLDPRLNSIHLDFPRRQEYRRCREALLSARGLLTLAAENANHLMSDPEQWPIRPDHVLPGTRYLLFDHRTGCANLLKTGLNTVGRLPSNDIRLEDLCVSRRHCAILVHVWGGCELHDTASRNGTLVNGQPVDRPIKLDSGDHIWICQRRLQFMSQEDYQAAGEGDEHPATVVD